MNSLKAVSAAAIGCITFAAIAMPASGQTLRAQRAAPAPPTVDGFAEPDIPEQKSMSCGRRFWLYHTQRGIAIYCHSNGADGEAKIIAIDHDKFPGGVQAAMTMLTRAHDGIKSGDGTVLWVRYRTPSAKARLICDLALKTQRADKCQELVSLNI